MQVIAFLGIGLMGLPMATRLIEAGFTLHVWNRSADKCKSLAKRGAMICNSAAEAVQGADFVITMVTDGSIVSDLLWNQDVGHNVEKHAVFIDMSSIKPTEAQAHAAKLAQLGIAALDAPVSGGTIGAEQGTLAIMVGGEKQAFEQAQTVFKCLGRAVHVGPSGTGQVAKLCNQQIVAITIGAVAEALHMAEKAGADPSAVRDALRGGFAESRILELHGARMLARNFVPGGTSAVQLKDMRNILETADKVGAAVPLSTQIEQRYAHLVDGLNGAGLDHSALLIELEDQTNRLSNTHSKSTD